MNYSYYKIIFILSYFIFFLQKSEQKVINYISEFFSDDPDDQNNIDQLKNWYFKINQVLYYKNDYFSICGRQEGRLLVGGYKVFIGNYDYYNDPIPTIAKRSVIQPIIPYWSFRVGIKIFKIDSWNKEKIDIYINKNELVYYKNTTYFNSCFNELDICGSQQIPEGTDLNYAYNDGIFLFNYNSTNPSNVESSLLEKIVSVEMISYHDAKENESWGFREFVIDIDACHPSCKTCYGYDQNQCKSCFSDSILQINTCVCKQSNTKMQLNLIQACYLNQSSFESCQLCQLSCQEGYYEQKSITNGVTCATCDQNCQTCLDSKSNCLSCFDSYYLEQNQSGNSLCKKCHSSCSTCNSFNICNKCSEGYYSLSSTSESTCLKCDDSCLTCKIRADNCIQCSQGYYLISYKGQQFCKKCSLNCQECIYDYSKMISVCKKCEEGKFMNESTKQCVSTSKECGQGYYGLQSERMCVSKCPELGYYQDEQLSLCGKCHPYCEKCFHKYQTHCQKCNQGYLLDGMTCTSQCLNSKKKIPDTINGDCNYYFSKSVSSNIEDIGVCKIACQQGTVYSSYDYTCIPCQNNCHNCTRDYYGDQECIECMYPYFLSNGRCLINCPQGQYKDPLNIKCSIECPEGYYKESNQQCLACMAGCKSCASNSTCEACFDFWIPSMEGEKIVNCKCENGYSNSNEQCIKCNENCKQCDPLTLKCFECLEESHFDIDPQSQQCSICKKGYKKDTTSQTCILCSDSDYLNLSQTECKCLEKCEACINSSECTSCKDKELNIDQKTCLCLSGYSQLEEGKSCQRCENGCDQCQTSTTCIKCQEGFYLDPNYKCVQNCTGQYYPDEINKICSTQCPNSKYGESNGLYNICKDCDQTCQQCKDSSTNCTICSENLYRIVENGQIKCISTCPQDTYFSSENPIKECIPCSTLTGNCINCNQLSCTKCADGFYLSNKECVPCIANCNKCSTKTTCSECKSGYENINYQCFEICKDGSFRQSGNPLCQSCQLNCSKCENTTDNCTECAPNFSKNASGFCTEQNCSDGQYLKNGDIFCSKCHLSCKKCIDSDRKCTECAQDFKQIDNSDINKGCELINCKTDDGYFNDGTNCIECSSNCKKCNNGTECTECYKYYELNNKECTQIKCSQQQCQFCSQETICDICLPGYSLNKNFKCECPSNQFDQLTQCKDCNPECQTCTGQASQCIQCKEGYEQYQGGQECFPMCENGQFKASLNQPCQNCNQNCKSCQKLSSNCTSCFEGYDLINGTCIEKCRIGYYRDEENNICSICSSSCLTCDKNKDFCTKCPSNQVINSQLLPNYQFCQEKCQEGFFFPSINSDSPIDITKLKCQKCDQNCKTCQDSQDNCTNCSDGFSLQNYQGSQKCKQNCPQKGTEIGLDTSLYCEKCDVNCKECETSITQCVSCQSNFDLVGQQCVQKCGEGEFLPKDKLFCEKCDITCKTCSNSSVECIECQNGYKKIEQNKCIKICNESQYQTPSYECIDCENKLCKTCIESPYKCISCQQGYDFIQSEFKCILEKCEDGKYLEIQDYQPDNSIGSIPSPPPNTKMYMCKKCSSNCKTCESSDSKCTSCLDTQELIENICYDLCKEGLFRDPLTKNCLSCDTTCKSCVTEAKKCTSCQSSLELIENKCYEICKSNEFRDSLKQCVLCDSTCKKCIESAGKCTQCDDTIYDFIDDKCLLKCKVDGEFRDEKKICSKCSTNCKKCSEQPNKCIECHQNFEMAINNIRFEKNECIPICKESEFINENKSCQLCDQNCMTCDLIATKCLSCKDGYDYDDIDFRCDEIIAYFQDFSPSGFLFVSLFTLVLMFILILVNPKNIYGLYTLQLVQMLGSYIAQYITLKPTLANDYFNPMYKFNISPLIPFNVINSFEENYSNRYFTNSYFQNNTIFHLFMIGLFFVVAFLYKNWSKQYGKLYFKIISATSNLFIFSTFYQLKHGTFNNNGFIIWSYVYMVIFLIGYLFSFFYTFYRQLYLLYSEIENKYFYHYLEARKIITNILIVFTPLKYSFSVLLVHSLISIVFIRSNPITLPGSLQSLVRFTEIVYISINIVIVAHSNILSNQSEIALIAFLIFFQVFLIIVIVAQLVRSYLIKRTKDNQFDLEKLIQFKLNVKSNQSSVSNSFSQGIESPNLNSKTVQWTQNPLQSHIFRNTSASILKTRKKEDSTLSQNIQDSSPLKKPQPSLINDKKENFDQL